jgi:hypothetical protein
MVDTQRLSNPIRLTGEQEKDGFWVEQSGNLVKVWHHNNTIALLLLSWDINRKVQDVVERKRMELRKSTESH